MTAASTGRPPLWAVLVATAGGAGLVPGAPGTYGTAVTVPLAWALGRAGLPWYLLATAVVTVVGSVAAGVFCRAVGKHDDQRIVVDEVAGYLVTLAPVAATWPNLIAGFVIFRIFDIWKPFPVRSLDRHVKGGFGVVADDLAAGVYGAAALWLLDRHGVLERALAWVRS